MAKKIKSILDKVMLLLTSIMLIATLLLLLWQVFSRYVLNSPSTFTNELLGFLLVWMSLFAASYAFGSNEHLSFSLIKNKFTKWRMKLVNILVNLFIVIFTISIFIIGGMKAVTSKMSQLTPILQIPQGALYIILPVSGLVILVYILLNTIINAQLSKDGGDFH